MKGRGVLAVLGGVVVWGALWSGFGAAFRAAMPGSFDDDGVTTSTGLLLVMVVISVGLSVLAGYLTATWSRVRMLFHVNVLATVQLLIGVAVQAGYWDVMPLWYHIVFLALVFPAHVAGGRLRAAGSAT